MSDDNTQPQGNSVVLDMLENEAGKFTANLNEDKPEAEPQPEAQPEQPQKEQQTDAAFNATSDLTVELIKKHFRKKYGDNPNIEKALVVWDDPLFATAFIAVLKKYNLSLFNLPVEIVLAGMLWKISGDFVSIMKTGAADAA